MKKEDLSLMDRDNQIILSLLTALEDDPNLTQKDLATRFGVAVGLVNSYLKRVIYKGFVKTKHLQRRRLQYLLTPTGIKEKSRLTYEFLTWSYQYIHLVRDEVKQKLLLLLHQGKTRVVFFGSGEVAELAYLALLEVKADLAGIVDSDHAGKRCAGHTILSLADLDHLESFDALIILYKNLPPETLAMLEEMANRRNIILLT